MKVLLIGCGMTGGAIAKSLLSLSSIQEFGLYSRTIKSAKALAFDLQSPKVRVLENLDSITKYNYIIIGLSGISDSDRIKSFNLSKTSYHVRQDELKYNLGAVAGLIPYLRKSSKDAPIIIVTNPVDEIVNYLRIALKHKNILGFGMELDVRRYSKVLGQPVLCIGVHGKAVPLINAFSNKEYEELYAKSDAELMEHLRKHGIPHSAAGEVFLSFFERISGNSQNIAHVSYYLEKSFHGVSGISLSLPFIVRKGHIIRVAPMNINSIEAQRFKSVASQLKHSVAHILTTSKKLVAYK